MGEVYRATDTKLKRHVAIKILPPALAADADRLARFQREAEVLASLNHPNIAAIHGLEESEGSTALVMELVEGDDLSQRIGRGAIPFDEALPIAKQIAEALEAAHQQGIIHRDLKPANIKLRPDGAVKVLDFGLAKALAPEQHPASATDRSQSPTITSPAMLTGAGIVLGTAAYMAPEQAKGREADKRSDIWAFGCVLYEMLTGRRPFDGEDMTEVLGAVVRLEPTWEALPSDVPAPVRTLLRRCLVKDRRARVGDIAAVLFVLDHEAGVAPAVPVASRSNRIAWLVAALATIALIATAVVAPANVSFGDARARPRPIHHRAAREHGLWGSRRVEVRATLHNLLYRLMVATSCSWPVPNPRSTSGCDHWPARKRGRLREPRAARFHSGRPTASSSRSSQGPS